MKNGGRVRFIQEVGNTETMVESPAGGGNILWLYSGTVSSAGSIRSYFHGDQTSVNGTYGTGATSGGTFSIGAKNNAGTEKYEGVIAEIMFFSEVLTSSEREYIEQYLGSKWGATINQ